jgi:hypothetical protein
MDDGEWLYLMHNYLISAGERARALPEQAVTALIPPMEGRPVIMSNLDFLAIGVMLARHGFALSPTVWADASGQHVRIFVLKGS